MSLIKPNIEGLRIHPLEKKEGDSSVVYKITTLAYPFHKNFQEIYCSHLRPYKIRGWYKNDNAAQNLMVMRGAIKFVVYDSRHSSTTKGNCLEVILNSSAFCCLHLPEALWYSFGDTTGEEAYIINCLPLAYEAIKKESLPIHSNLIPYSWGKSHAP